MTGSASDTVRLLLERYANGGVENLIELLAGDAVFVVSPEASMEPDTYRGPEGARRYFAGFEGAIDGVSFEIDEIEDALPGVALARLTTRGYGEVTRIPVELSTFMTFEVRDGLVERIVAHGDLDSARREIERQR